MMKGQQTYMFHLHNGIRAYHWGSTDAISRLLGYGTDISPQAELWLGAHPGNPSRVESTGQALDELISSDPERFLGSPVSDRFGQLPFLMKVLAAARPLSIQVHPSLTEAREGFEREDDAGIAHDAAHRNYKDANHKPEMLYALGDFVALSGFREPLRILEDLQAVRPQLTGQAAATCDELVSVLESGQDPLGRALRLVLTGGEPVRLLAQQLADRIHADPELSRQPQLAEVRWAAGYYPADPGVLVALLMNVVTLEAGEAIALGSGNIHAYLRGLGIEVMANSDNVLRGGLTSKHIDVPELLAITRTEPGQPCRLPAQPLGADNNLFTPDFEEFRLQVIDTPDGSSGDTHSLVADGGAIALCTAGSFTLKGDGQQLLVQRGESVFLPAGVDYQVTSGGTGPATLFVASTRPVTNRLPATG